MRTGFPAVAAGLMILLAWLEPLSAQSFERGGGEFNALREVIVPSDRKLSVAVVEFLHHGQIASDGKNVLVSTKDEHPVASRILQLGPGDFCRLAFETVRGQKYYEVLYGGPGAKEAAPAWTNNDGLLLETRTYQDCNLNRFESVRDAFGASSRIGSDYVPSVLHANNPFAAKPEPFLSRYSGCLRVPTAGTYGFVISSQDCSFLLIDDKLVAAEPGVHRARHHALPGSRKDVSLTAGEHKFEYYHAATGPEAMMIAAWEPSPAEAKPKPAAIPAECFRAAAVGRVTSGAVMTREAKFVPDFTFTTTGDVPLPDNDMPLVAATFTDLSPPGLTTRAKLQWDFGDGQTSEAPSPTHVYLHPGLYTVTLTVYRGEQPLKLSNRVAIDRPFLAARDAAKAAKLDDFLPILTSYNLKRLDAAGLRQLAAAYQWKIDTLAASLEGLTKDDGRTLQPLGEAPPKDSPAIRRQEEALRAEIRKYQQWAVTVGRAAFVEEDAAAQGDDDLNELARIVGPIARDRLGDSLLAGHLWAGALKRIAKPELKARYAISAADIAVNDLNNTKAAKTFLDVASTLVAKGARGRLASRLYRVWGDYYAATGKGDESRKAYLEAQTRLESSQTNTERTAWQGAYSRSAEQFLKSNELDRAVAEIRAWERDFPADKIDGYMTFLYARYWAGREMYAQAIALSEQLLAVNPASPYIDQLLFLAADCEVKRGQMDRAAATLHSLLKDYPGSPLIPTVRKTLQAVESSQVESPRKAGTRNRGR
jgi:TolA-binding protein